MTTREIPFKYASRKYEKTHKVVHTNVTAINMEKSYQDKHPAVSSGDKECKAAKYNESKGFGYDPAESSRSSTGDRARDDVDTKKVNFWSGMEHARTQNIKYHEVFEQPDEANLKTKVLSPEQEAVRSFLSSRRPSSGNQKSGFVNPAGYVQDQSGKKNFMVDCDKNLVEHGYSQKPGETLENISPVRKQIQTSFAESPPIASSTFREGNGMNMSILHSDMSPVSFTLRNDAHDKTQYLKIASEESKLEDNFEAEISKTNGHGSSNSNLSCTFRNDSQMIATNAEEDLPGYTRNQAFGTTHITCGMDSSSENEACEGTEIVVQADVEVDVPRETMKYEMSEATVSQPTSTPDEALSLTNVTEFTGDYLNSFTDTADVVTRSRWINKDVFMFQRDRIPTPVLTMDETGDGRKPPVQAQSDVRSSETDFLKEAEKHLEVFKTRRNSQNRELLTAGVCQIKQSRESLCNGFGEEYGNDEMVREKQSDILKPEQTADRLLGGSPDRTASSHAGNPDQPVSDIREDFNGQRPCPLPRNCRNKSTFTRYSPQKRGLTNGSPVIVLDRKLPVDERTREHHSDREHNSDREHHSEHKVHGNEETSNFINNMNSTREFETLEKQFNRECYSKRNRLSRSLTHLSRIQPEHFSSLTKQDKSLSCTNSVDLETRSIINENAKYHFLHDKGMIKISSPSLKLLSHVNGSKQILEKRYNDIDEESDDITDNGSEMSGVYVDSKFKIPCGSMVTTPEPGSLQTQSELTATGSQLTEPVPDYNDDRMHKTPSDDHLHEQQALENQQLEEYLQTVDAHQQNWDENVLQWINERYHGDSPGAAELEHELQTLLQEEMEDGEEKELTCNENKALTNSLSTHEEESVYYSVLGQSEELKMTLTPLQKGETPTVSVNEHTEFRAGLMEIIKTRSEQDIANFLNSDRIVSERELKDAVTWALETRQYNVAVLLLEDICKLIYGAEEDCVDVFPAYEEGHRWAPVFVMLTKQDCGGEWDSFMGFRVYKRRYDRVSCEAAAVINSDYVQSHPLSVEDFQAIRRAVSSADLHKKHGKITVINACPCRSKNNGEFMEEGLCIVIHCLVKGLIPFSEEPFPKEILGIPVDVREGYFRLGVGRAQTVEDTDQRVQENDIVSGDESDHTEYLKSHLAGSSKCGSVKSHTSGGSSQSEDPVGDIVETDPSSRETSDFETDGDNVEIIQSVELYPLESEGDKVCQEFLPLENNRAIQDLSPFECNCGGSSGERAVMEVDSGNRCRYCKLSDIQINTQVQENITSDGDTSTVEGMTNSGLRSDNMLDKVVVLILVVLCVCFQLFTS